MQSRLNHIAIVAADPERSARVFESILGANVTLPTSGHRGPPEVSAHLPGVTLVFVAGTLAHSDSPTAHVALNVTRAELHACKESLATLGLWFEEPRHGPKDRALYFMDYDNNLFELCATEVVHESDA